MNSKPLCIRFDEIDGFIKIDDGISYLILFGHWWYDELCDKIKYLIKCGFTLKRVCNMTRTSSINHNFARIRIDLYNSLSIEKTLNFYNDIIQLRQLLLRMKITVTIICFYKKVCITINPIHNIFKWMFAYLYV